MTEKELKYIERETDKQSMKLWYLTSLYMLLLNGSAMAQITQIPPFSSPEAKYRSYRHLTAVEGLEVRDPNFISKGRKEIISFVEILFNQNVLCSFGVGYETENDLLKIQDRLEKSYIKSREPALALCEGDTGKQLSYKDCMLTPDIKKKLKKIVDQNYHDYFEYVTARYPNITEKELTESLGLLQKLCE